MATFLGEFPLRPLQDGSVGSGSPSCVERNHKVALTRNSIWLPQLVFVLNTHFDSGLIVTNVSIVMHSFFFWGKVVICYIPFSIYDNTSERNYEQMLLIAILFSLVFFSRSAKNLANRKSGTTMEDPTLERSCFS